MGYIDYFKNKGIKIFDNIPNGFVKVERCSAPNGYEWYSNNKSLFSKERIHILVKNASKEEKLAIEIETLSHGNINSACLSICEIFGLSGLCGVECPCYNECEYRESKGE